MPNVYHRHDSLVVAIVMLCLLLGSTAVVCMMIVRWPALNQDWRFGVSAGLAIMVLMAGWMDRMIAAHAEG